MDRALSRFASISSELPGPGVVPMEVILDPVATESDLLVAKVRLVDRMEPAAVVKVARSPEAAQELSTDLSVVSALRDDPRLADWTSILPRRIASWTSPTSGYSLEVPIVGVDGRRLDWTDLTVATAAISAAAEAVGQLHRRTGRRELISERQVGRLVRTPVAALFALYRDHSRQFRSLRRLESRLSSRMMDQEMTLGWVHGDYTPGNLIMAPDGSSVRGIVDWGGGLASAPACMDTVTLLLSTRMLRDRRELGPVMLEIARGAVLTDAEERLLAGDPSDLEAQWKLALSWLNHVSANLRKASYYGRHLLWRAINVDPVLEEVAGW